MREGFLTDIRTAELFFRVRRRYKIDKREDCIALMRELTKRKKAKYIRDINDFTKGRKVVYVKPRGDK